ncbi:hypothetical protein BSKO_02018 [Bryopsis sp. KO-2023]|nr:hypothetical protein BSKO_02018 [Bryopsis sp. KO-2023]
MPADGQRGEPTATNSVVNANVAGNDQLKRQQPTPGKGPGVASDMFWGLRRKVADIVTEFEFIAREAQQLSQKRVLSPPLEAMYLTEEEQRLLQNNHQKRLQDIVQKHCSAIIKNLMVYKWAFPFNQPVDTNIYKDYPKFVRKPMDLGTIKAKMSTYRNPYEFESDVRLVFSNARAYNPEGTDVRKMADAVEEKFVEKWNKNIVAKLNDEQRACAEEERSLRQSKAGLMVMKTEGDIDHNCGLLLGRLEKLLEQIHYTQCLAAGVCGYVTGEERVRLGWEMTTLAPEHFQRAANLVLTRHPGLMAMMKDNTIQLDLEKMDALTLRQLQDFVAQCRKSRHRLGRSGRDSVSDSGRVRKKQKTSGTASGSNTPDALHASRSSVQWPHIPYGIGLKPYKPESEPCIPHIPAQPPFRHTPFRTHCDPSKASHQPIHGNLNRVPSAHRPGHQSGLGGIRRIQTTAALRTPGGEVASSPRVITPRGNSAGAVPQHIPDRVLFRTQGSFSGSSTLPQLGSGVLVGTTNVPGAGESGTPDRGLSAGVPDSMASERPGPLLTAILPPSSSLSNMSYLHHRPQPPSLPTSFLTTGILPFSQHVPPSVLGQHSSQPIAISGVSSPFVVPMLGRGLVGNGVGDSSISGSGVPPVLGTPGVGSTQQQLPDIQAREELENGDAGGRSKE